jgi:hypothetical protein
MSKNNKAAVPERPKVDPLGDLKIAESRGKLITLIRSRLPGAD